MPMLTGPGEGLRVVEEFCRFSLGDAFLSGELKRLRHDLAEALSELSPTLLLEARETQQDVGTGLATPSEQARHSLADVVLSNCEAALGITPRSEEYGKLRGATMGRALKGLRFRVYTLERALLLGFRSRDRLQDARLYVLVSGSLCTASVEWTIKEAAGGAQISSVREKDQTDRELLRRARNVRRMDPTGRRAVHHQRPPRHRPPRGSGRRSRGAGRVDGP